MDLLSSCGALDPPSQSCPGQGAGTKYLSLAQTVRESKGGLQTQLSSRTLGATGPPCPTFRGTTPSGYFGLTTGHLSPAIASLCQEIAMENLQVEGTQPTAQCKSVLTAPMPVLPLASHSSISGSLPPGHCSTLGNRRVPGPG